MTRALFGGSDDDRVESIYGLGSKKLSALAADVVLTFWTDPTGGEQYTDLLLATWDDATDEWVPGAAVTQVTSDDEGYWPSIFGPDGVLGMWAQAAGSNRRFRVQTMDAAAISAAQAAVAADLVTVEQAKTDAQAAAAQATAPTADQMATVAADEQSAFRGELNNAFAGKSRSGNKAVGQDETVFNVLDHGAKGDGTDDAAAINATINAANAAGGGRVLLPDTAAGYGAGSTISVKAGVTLEGRGKVALKAVGAARPTHIALVGANAAVEGVTVDCNGLITSSACDLQAAATNARVERCAFKDTGFVAIYGTQTFTGISGVRILNNTYDGLKTAIQLTFAHTDTRVEGNVITNWQQRGIYVLGDATRSSTDLRITGNKVYGMAAGGTVRYPIQFIGNAATPHVRPRVNFNTVIGPAKAYTAADPGTADNISIQHCVDFEVIGNTSRDGGDMGLTVALGCSRGKVAINTCQGNDVAGIDLGDSSATDTSRITVTGNVCMNNGQNHNGDRTAASRAGIRAVNIQLIALAGNVLGDDQATKTQQYGASFTGCTTVNAAGDVDAGNALGLYNLDGAGNTGMAKASTAPMP